MKKIILSLICCFPLLAIGQTTDINIDQISKEDQAKMLEWYLDLTERGIEMTEDSIKLSKEFIKVLNDDAYRGSLFPATYTWEQTIPFIKRQELKQVFWYFINLYPQNDTNKELVVKAILAYDQAFKMDEMLVNTFYTYSFMDPEISVIEDGKPEIIRPDILEEKLQVVKEMVTYIRAYRQQNLASEKSKE